MKELDSNLADIRSHKHFVNPTLDFVVRLTPRYVKTKCIFLIFYRFGRPDARTGGESNINGTPTLLKERGDLED